MSQSVVVTGVGILSAAGRGAQATERALVEMRSGLGALTLFQSERNGALPVAEVAPEHVLAGAPRSRALASVALAEAIDAAELRTLLPSTRIGLSLGCCVGGMPETEVAVAGLLAGVAPDPAVWLRHELGQLTVTLADTEGLAGPRLTVSTACASGAQAIANGAELIRAGLADAVLAGGVDALCRLTLGGFASLLLIDPDGCRPFSTGRRGMSLGEGAAFLALESAAHASGRGAKILVTLAGWANTCDAHHPTAPDPEGRGAEAAMRQALAASGLTPRDLDYVNAHGTGTPGNDLAEGIALQRLLDPEARTAVSSTKRIFGHTLGAAGAVEAAVTALALERGFVPGTRGRGVVDPDCRIRPTTRSKPGRPRIALSNSFGFGGNNAVLCFAAPEVEVASPDPGSGALPAALPTLGVFSYALAGARSDLPLPAARRVDLPEPGPHKRRPRLAGLATALVRAVAPSEVPRQSAVLLGTALGSLTETEAFVEALLRDGEGAASPRAFSASVHNAVSSRPAIAVCARGENQTFVHGGLSFAHALFAAARRAARGVVEPAFVGALDELTSYVLRGRAAGGCAGEPGEGGAVLRLGALGPPTAPLATLRLVGFASLGTDQACAEWLNARPELKEASAVLATAPDQVSGRLGVACIDVTPFTGDHPSRGAVAAALAVAVLSGELPGEALGLDAAPRSLALVMTSRFGEVALAVVDQVS